MERKKEDTGRVIGIAVLAISLTVVEGVAGVEKKKAIREKKRGKAIGYAILKELATLGYDLCIFSLRGN